MLADLPENMGFAAKTVNNLCCWPSHTLHCGCLNTTWCVFISFFFNRSRTWGYINYWIFLSSQAIRNIIPVVKHMSVGVILQYSPNYKLVHLILLHCLCHLMPTFSEWQIGKGRNEFITQTRGTFCTLFEAKLSTTHHFLVSFFLNVHIISCCEYRILKVME